MDKELIKETFGENEGFIIFLRSLHTAGHPIKIKPEVIKVSFDIENEQVVFTDIFKRNKLYNKHRNKNNEDERIKAAGQKRWDVIKGSNY